MNTGIGETFGAALIGAMVMATLYGLTTLQTYMYFRRYPKDSHSFKMLVSLLWALDTVHVIFVCHAIYHYLILNFATPSVLLVGVWSLFASIAINASTALVTQIFYLRRVHALCGQRWMITGFISLSIIAHFAFGIETVIEMLLKKQLNRLHEITYIAALPFAILAVLSDVLITAALCILLWNKKTGFKSTNDVLNRLMVYAINRCLLTSIVAIIEIITFTTLPNAFWFLGIDFVIGKLYANSLLATLNSRASLRGKGQDMDVEEELDPESRHFGEVSFPVFRVGHNIVQDLTSTSASDTVKDELGTNVELGDKINIFYTEGF